MPFGFLKRSGEANSNKVYLSRMALSLEYRISTPDKMAKGENFKRKDIDDFVEGVIKRYPDGMTVMSIGTDTCAIPAEDFAGDGIPAV